MAAERRRRQLEISRNAKDAPVKAGNAEFVADEVLRARIEAEHFAAAQADPWKRVALARNAVETAPFVAEKPASPG